VSLKATASSLHDSIMADIRSRIVSGEWKPGFRLPIEAELTQHYGCSRMTVNKAMTQLANAGLIERRKRAGSFVKTPRSQSPVLELNDIQDDVAAMGRAYHFALASCVRRRSTGSDKQRLGLSAAAPVLALSCLHFAGGIPYCHEDRLINLSAVPEAAQQNFALVAPGRWLIQHVPWTEAEHRIRAMTPGADMAVTLMVQPFDACLVLERLTWLAGVPVTDVLLTYPASMRELTARFSTPHT
jgi:GntR family transcriptional regulator, histidine utilization repressor